jgi:hypothetical protein
VAMRAEVLHVFELPVVALVSAGSVLCLFAKSVSAGSVFVPRVFVLHVVVPHVLVLHVLVKSVTWAS